MKDVFWIFITRIYILPHVVVQIRNVEILKYVEEDLFVMSFSKANLFLSSALDFSTIITIELVVLDVHIVDLNNVSSAVEEYV